MESLIPESNNSLDSYNKETEAIMQLLKNPCCKKTGQCLRLISPNSVADSIEIIRSERAKASAGGESDGSTYVKYLLETAGKEYVAEGIGGEWRQKYVIAGCQVCHYAFFNMFGICKQVRKHIFKELKLKKIQECAENFDLRSGLSYSHSQNHLLGGPITNCSTSNACIDGHSSRFRTNSHLSEQSFVNYPITSVKYSPDFYPPPPPSVPMFLSSNNKSKSNISNLSISSYNDNSGYAQSNFIRESFQPHIRSSESSPMPSAPIFLSSSSKSRSNVSNHSISSNYDRDGYVQSNLMRESYPNGLARSNSSESYRNGLARSNSGVGSQEIDYVQNRISKINVDICDPASSGPRFLSSQNMSKSNYSHLSTHTYETTSSDYDGLTTQTSTLQSTPPQPLFGRSGSAQLTENVSSKLCAEPCGSGIGRLRHDKGSELSYAELQFAAPSAPMFLSTLSKSISNTSNFTSNTVDTSGDFGGSPAPSNGIREESGPIYHNIVYMKPSTSLLKEDVKPRLNGHGIAVSAPMFLNSLSKSPMSYKSTSTTSISTALPNACKDRDMEWLSEWRMADSSKVKDITTGRLFFSGAARKLSLNGGCGWWLLIEDTVLSYGSVSVQLTFPSLISLEYEALLLGLEDALRKGLRHILVHSTNELILERVTAASDTKYFYTIDYETREVLKAIQETLNRFDTCRFIFVPESMTKESKRLAVKATSNGNDYST